MLALPGPQHVFQYTGDFTCNGVPIVLRQEGGMGRGTGWAVWDASVTLAHWLQHISVEQRLQLLPPGKAFLELGSGTGIAGLSAAACLDQGYAHLSDLPSVLPALRHNVQLNPAVSSRVSVVPCDWESVGREALPAAPYALVIAADCVWLEALVQPFINALLTATGPKSKVLLAHQCRSQRVDDAFFPRLAAAFKVESVSQRPGEPERGAIDLYICERLE
ncbi:hypothetical protein ACKKBF_B32690 [Auxenochlorella protothecoides x Auxenochlorella symbiontica]